MGKGDGLYLLQRGNKTMLSLCLCFYREFLYTNGRPGGKLINARKKIWETRTHEKARQRISSCLNFCISVSQFN